MISDFSTTTPLLENHELLFIKKQIHKKPKQTNKKNNSDSWKGAGEPGKYNREFYTQQSFSSLSIKAKTSSQAHKTSGFRTRTTKIS